LRCLLSTSTTSSQNKRDIPKITILLDHGYHPEYLTQELERIYQEIMTKIQFQLSTKPSKQEKAAQGKSGFVPAIAFRGDRTLQCLDGALQNSG